ncbi:MAG: hypothetical protein AAGC46_11085 [Solirubrobacteraceae bacterium]
MPRVLTLIRSPRPALLAAAVSVGLVSPAAAQAATTVSIVGGAVTIAGDDTASVIRAPYSSIGQLEIQDTSGAAVVPGTGCAPEGGSPSWVTCGPATAVRSITVSLGGGDDDYKWAITEDVPQTVDAGEGNDTVETGNGKDVVNGGPGNDDLTGGRGDDIMDGGAGDDTVDGWDGNDTITGGPGRDKLLGDGGTLYYGGSDTIYARDGEGDQVDCGGGADLAQIDALDTVSACATVDRPVVTNNGGGGGTNPGGGGGGGGTPVVPVPAPALAVTGTVTKTQSIKNLVAGKKLQLGLTANAACSGKVAIAVGKAEAKRLKLGGKALTLGTSDSVAFPAGIATTVSVGVSSKYRAKLKGASKVKATLVIACAATSGTPFAGSADLTLKR